MRLLISGSWVRAPRWALISFAGIVFEAGCPTANHFLHQQQERLDNLSNDIQLSSVRSARCDRRALVFIFRDHNVHDKLCSHIP